MEKTQIAFSERRALNPQGPAMQQIVEWLQKLGLGQYFC